jgi:hypothetical protein
MWRNSPHEENTSIESLSFTMTFYRVWILQPYSMHKKKSLKKFSTAVKKMFHYSMKPFKQLPPVNMKDPSNTTNEQLNGADLFSHFTADVIKKDILFER